MNEHSKQSAIIWLTKNGISLYSLINNAIINLDFPSDCLRFLEVVDEKKFQQLIVNFINQHQFPQFKIHLIVGPDALIEKELPSINQIDKGLNEKQILENIPFENIYSKKWTYNNQVRIAGFNANLYEGLKNAFRQVGWTIETVNPYFIIHQINFTSELASTLLKKPEVLIQENMIKNAVFGTDSQSEIKIDPPKKNLLPILLVIFFSLLFILIIFFFLRSKKKPTLPPASTLLPTVKINQSISAVPQATPSASLAAENPVTQSGKIKITPTLTPIKYPITITP